MLGSHQIVGPFTPRGDGNEFVDLGGSDSCDVIVGPFTPRGDGNRLAIGYKGVRREGVAGSFTTKRSRISTAAPSLNFALRQAAATLRREEGREDHMGVPPAYAGMIPALLTIAKSCSERSKSIDSICT